MPLPSQDGSTFCVAPIVDSEANASVQFWAAGVDCCGGRFDCDDAWDGKAHAGVRRAWREQPLGFDAPPKNLLGLTCSWLNGFDAMQRGGRTQARPMGPGLQNQTHFMSRELLAFGGHELRYASAVRQAEAAYGLKSAKEPIFVQWVIDPEKAGVDMSGRPQVKPVARPVRRECRWN